MPGPKPPEVTLSAAERRELERLVCAQKTPQAVVRRARVVLLAASGSTNLEIARQVPMDEEAVGVWRRRWAAVQSVPLDELSVTERLADAERDSKIADVCAIYRTAQERAETGQRTVSTDELTHVQALERLAPDLPPRPGRVARREFEYKRHGTCSFFINV